MQSRSPILVPNLRETLKARGFWKFTARNPDGTLKWEEEVENLVVTTGKNYILDTGLGGSLYIGFTGDAPTPNAADTMASHGGWTEVTAYDEATRQLWNAAAAAAGTKTNSGNVATITCDANSTAFGGAFLTTNNVKGGSTGTLVAVSAFTTRTLNDNETLDITVDMSV